jgi:hypothetical protein
MYGSEHNKLYYLQSIFLKKNVVDNRICDSLQCGTVVACWFVDGLFNDSDLTNNVLRTFVE